MWRILAALLLMSPAIADTITPVDRDRCAAMTARGVLHEGAPVDCARLAVLRFSFIDFAGRPHDDGEIVVLDAVAPYVAHIFAGLYERRFPIAKAQAMETYNGDDAAAMADDNTSGFNHRRVAGSGNLSLHAFGAAIDLNPVENPYLTRSGAIVTVAPPQSQMLNRRQDRVGKPVRPGMADDVVDLFAENGFVEWGGDWDDPIDYQHFDIGRALAVKLAAETSEQARVSFATVVAAYQHCVAQYSDKDRAQQRQICARSRRS